MIVNESHVGMIGSRFHSVYTKVGAGWWITAVGIVFVAGCTLALTRGPSLDSPATRAPLSVQDERSGKPVDRQSDNANAFDAVIHGVAFA
jgi:hypothetical protein